MEQTLLNRLRKFGYGQHHGPMAKACAEAADEIERLRAALKIIADESAWPGMGEELQETARRALEQKESK